MKPQSQSSDRSATSLGLPLGMPSTGFALLGSYVLLAFATFFGSGTYTPLALVLALLSFASLASGLTLAWSRSRFDRKAPHGAFFAAALVAFLLVSSSVSPVYYLHQCLYGLAFRIWVVVYGVLVAAVYLFGPRRWVRARRAVFLAGVAAAFAFRIWLPIASPAPWIDVFPVFQESSQHLLEGKNPYTTPVSDVYQGKVNFGYTLRGYDYLPANLYLLAPVWAVTGDIRYGYVLAEAGIIAILWRLARRRCERSVAELLPLLLLYHPRGLFVIEQAWAESLILFFFAVWLLLYQRGNRAWASTAYGYMLGLKAYLFFFLFQWLFVERNWRYLLLGIIVAVMTVLPFLLLDWRSFVAEGVLRTLQSGFRADSLTIFGFLAPVLGIEPPKLWSVGVGAVLALMLVLPLRKMPPLRGYLFATTTTTFGMFLFGSQAFCNYYWFVSGMILFLLASGGGDDPAWASPLVSN